MPLESPLGSELSRIRDEAPGIHSTAVSYTLSDKGTSDYTQNQILVIRWQRVKKCSKEQGLLILLQGG